MIYSVAAILLLGVAFLNVNQKIHGTDERIMFSELTVEMTGVGAEILDEIGKELFDPVTSSGLTIPTSDLSTTPYSTASTCDPNDPNYSGCSTIGDFHGKTATRNRTRTHSVNGATTTYTVPYNVTDIAVDYVSEASPHTSTGGAKSFAKEVTLTVSTPALVNGNGDPFEIQMSRVYMYPDL